MGRRISADKGNNPHPARGRKHHRRTGYCRNRRNNPHPARGRKQVRHRPGIRPLIETTHTPQGDGNLMGSSHDISSSQKQPTPRKGTETELFTAFCVTRPGNNPHPARGRKRGFHNPKVFLPGNNPHPARGRKRSRCLPRF